MTNKEKVDNLISDISELKELVNGMRDMDICPLSFFSQTFDLAYKILRDLHVLEGLQIDAFQKQMQAYQDVIESALLLQETASAPFTGKQPVSLNEAMEKKNLSDFRKAFSLNDRFYFRKELFGDDEAKMNKIISDLNDIQSYEESVRYLNDKQGWETENDAVPEFMKLLEKRFR
ncbi:MAG: hypothetical protein LBS05_01635 [Tannerellaceae bacterium]|jgi:hypothetical protein|nr:hypothetical protein [Tannerellaceae bacterium]